jgi:uncharacterized membrane protein YhaH (DUF805 family)
MSWFLQVLRKYAVFSGRARRKEYWFFVLFYLILAIVLCAIDIATGTFNEETGFGLLSGLLALGLLIPSLAVTVRRLHDTGRTGWWILIGLVPLVGFIVMLVFTVLDGTPGDNRFGPDSKAAAA